MPDDQVRQLLDQARESLKYGQYHSAAGQARQILEFEPENSEAHAILGIALSRLNHVGEATRALETALRLAPDNPRNHYNLAAHFFAVGRREDSLRMAREALRREPDHTAAADLVRRLETEEASPAGFAPQPLPPEVLAGPNSTALPEPVAPRKTSSRLGLSGSRAMAWDLVGWFLAISATILYYYMQRQLGPIVEGQESPFSPSPEAMQAFEEHAVYFIGFFGAWFLWSVWWVVDMVDRRPPILFILMGVAGIPLLCCCPPISLVGFSSYMILRRKY